MEKRLVYLDRLKVFLTVLVVLHHTSITYGGAGSWFYNEHPNNDVANAILSMFTAVNQSFFMGLFFFISGYMTPSSYDKKGTVGFLKARLFRFGIPLLSYMILIPPLLRYVSMGYEGSMGKYMKEKVFSNPLQGITGFATGPLWYLVALLLFFFAYAGFRLITRWRVSDRPFMLTPRVIAGYLVTVAVANFAVRLAFPVGKELLNLQLAYFPAYIGLFMAGIAAYRGNWLEGLTEAAARKWRLIVIVLIALLPVGMTFGGALEGNASAFKGGFTWSSAYYSVSDPIMGLGISYMLLVWFRKRRNGAATRMTSLLSANAFLVYIVHALIVTYVGFGLRHLSAHPLLKFALTGCISLLLCFTLASVIRRIPGVKKVV